MPDVAAPVADPDRHALARSHAAENDLWAVRAQAAFCTVEQTSFDEVVGELDDRRLALGPQPGHLLGALLLDGLGPGLGGILVLREGGGGGERHRGHHNHHDQYRCKARARAVGT